MVSWIFVCALVLYANQVYFQSQYDISMYKESTPHVCTEPCFYTII